jgi:hypothetical protein
MGPGQLSPQRGDSRLLGKDLRKAHHVMQVLRREAAAAVNGQFSRQCGDNFLAIPATLAAENFAMDALADLPVQPGQLGVDGYRRSQARLCYQLADFVNQHSRRSRQVGHFSHPASARPIRIFCTSLVPS